MLPRRPRCLTGAPAGATLNRSRRAGAFTMANRILVAGASGLLGGHAARKLLQRGFAVRGLTRNPARLADLSQAGAEVVQGDLLAPDSLARACEGVDQVFSTANSFMGRGASSPTRVDLPGYRNLLEAGRRAGVRRLVHTSAYGIAPDSTVDYFRVKAAIDQLIQASDLPWVLLRPTAFLDIWISMPLADARAGRPVRLFGNGRRVTNYIAAADVAEFAVRVLERPEVVREVIDLGGPSTLSQHDLVDLIERSLGRTVPRRHAALPVLRIGSVALRPFNEVLARLMAMGVWSAQEDRPLDHWRQAAARFGVEPMTAEAFLSRLLAAESATALPPTPA